METPEKERDFTQVLTKFVGANEKDAQHAFDQLLPDCRRYITQYFRYSCGVSDTARREDLEQMVVMRLWTVRHTFKPRGEAAWYGFVRRVAYHCFVDQCRKRRADAFPDTLDITAIPDSDLSIVESVLAALDTEQFFEIADQVLLDERTPLPPDESARQLLAAQLFYLDNEPWDYIVALLTATKPTAPLTRGTLDFWLTDPRVIRRLAYGQLYWEKSRLVTFLCSPESASLWSDTEKAVVQWRYQQGLSPEQVYQRQDCSLTEEMLNELFDRCVALLPFKTITQQLLARLRERGAGGVIKTLATNAVWQRLAFQYRYADQLAHKDILERTEAAAQVAGCALTPGMLNVWLSNGRLLRRVAARWSHHQEEVKDVL